MHYFTMEELCSSDTARTRHIDNTPDAQSRKNLEYLVDNLLDPVRDMLRKPIKVNSGFRCPQLNQVLGGAKDSQHLRGMAVDIVGPTPKDTLDIFNIIREYFTFDQLIFEKQVKDARGNVCPKWVHVSLREAGNRGQILKTLDGRTYTSL